MHARTNHRLLYNIKSMLHECIWSTIYGHVYPILSPSLMVLEIFEIVRPIAQLFYTSGGNHNYGETKKWEQHLINDLQRIFSNFSTHFKTHAAATIISRIRFQEFRYLCLN